MSRYQPILNESRFLKKIDHSLFFTKTASKRQPSPIRELAPLLREPGMISLAGGLLFIPLQSLENDKSNSKYSGMPNPSTFPFKSLSFDVPTRSSVLNSDLSPSSTTNLESIATDSILLTASELDQALQYSASKGIPALHSWLRRFHDSVHHIPYSEWDLCISTGSQDLITRTFDTILEDGDSIIIEAPTYSGTLSYLKARNIEIISVDMDSEGMIPHKLEEVLHSIQSAGRRPPKLLYTIPIGQNPSGTSYSLQRKQTIYDIVCKHNILLFEDDPYYFLDFDHMDPLQPRAVSFQSMDIESRVIRSDSFSKVLSSGLRMGYLTGHSTVIRNIELNMQSTC